jgi:hypothetical protein
VVFVEGYNQAFKVTAYDNQVMRYIPFIWWGLFKSY